MFLFRVFQTFNSVIIQTSGYVAGVLAVIPWRPTSIWSSNIINISEYKPDPPGRFQREQRRNQNPWCNSAPEPEHFKATTSDTFLDLHRTPPPPSFFFFVPMMEKDTQRETVRLHKTAGSSVRRPEGVVATNSLKSPWPTGVIVVILCISAMKQ